MKGLELSRRYYWEVGRPALLQQCPDLMPRIAAGLVGEGSECLGLDDELSRDHDWGPGFCLWLTDEDFEQYGALAASVYAALPTKWLGYERLRPSPLSAGRVGVMRIGDFYQRFLGLQKPPETVGDWLSLSEPALCACTNGEVFEDGAGCFSAFRRELAAYYPEDIRRKHLAARCALAARAGQYQLPRCLRRGDLVAAYYAQAEFAEHAQAILFLLARRYRPYSKWAHRLLKELPGMEEAVPLFERLAVTAPRQAPELNEALCGLIIRRLRTQGLSTETDDFLLSHAQAIQGSIGSAGIRSLPLFAFG